MKKGKRQVLEKNFFQSQDHQPEESNYSAFNNPSTSDSNSTSFFDSTFQKNIKETEQISPSEPSKIPYRATKRSEVQNISISPISQDRNTKQQVQTNKNDTAIKNMEEKDDKKSRIEMLKQKYLKKTEVKPKENEIIQQSQPKDQTPHRHQLVKMQPKIEEKQESSRKVQTLYRNKVQPPTKDIEYQPQQKNIAVRKQITVDKELTSNDQIERDVVIEKKVEKGFKVPPPPPAKRGPRAPVPPAPVRPKQIISDQPEPEPQKQVYQPNQTLSKIEKQSPVSPPKRPNSRPNSVQQIIAKRLKKEDIITKDARLQAQQSESIEFHQQANIQNLPARSMPLDEEYIDKKPDQLETKHQKFEGTLAKQQYSFDVREAISIWYSDPDGFFGRILPRGSSLLQTLINRTHKQLVLTSKNKGFSSLVQKMLVQFVFRSQCQLTEGQKDVISDLALQYFYSNLNSLTAQFLLVIVKLGSQYLTKYTQFFKQHLQSYCLTLLSYKDYFLSQQLTNFVDFILSAPIPAQEVLHLLILLQPTDQLTSFIFSLSLQDQRQLVLSLGACHYLSKNNKNVLGIYFKLISLLIDCIAKETSLLEGVLKYINQIQPQQKYYQLQKQLKLKLINIISNSATHHQVPQQKEKETKEEGKGFMGIWNKAIDKFKTATTQLTEKPKTTQPQETQAPEDDITYDPVLKRYLINGKVPQDEDGRSATANVNTTAKPPPPPPKANRPVAPPPPPGKKGRTVTATNRYA